jgi:DNA-binding NtrC family response regulator
VEADAGLAIRLVAMTHDRWLLDRAMALLDAVMAERDREARRLVRFPPEGATLHEIERAALVAALEESQWVQAQAARRLGLTPRVMLYKMTRYQVYRDHPTTPREGPRQTRHKTRQTHAPRTPGKDWRLNVGTF